MLSELFDPGVRIEDMTEPEPVPEDAELALRVRAILTCEGEPESCQLVASLTHEALAKLGDDDVPEFLHERLMRRAMNFPNDGFRVAHMNFYSEHVFDDRHVES